MFKRYKITSLLVTILLFISACSSGNQISEVTEPPDIPQVHTNILLVCALDLSGGNRR